ncbi:MAG TPA: hypothetical protein VHC98_02535 [Candidatus Saccharimonadales bacterium]|nr:hypothetical protein [Candidatus Saccharimonadales bacterium]
MSLTSIKQSAMARRLALGLTAVVAIAGVCNAWFLSFGIRTDGDWGFLLKSTADTLRRYYFSTWLSDMQFGRVLFDAGQAPTYALYGVFSAYLHTGYALNERLIHLWPAVIIAVVSSYLLVHHMFRDMFAAILGAIVYSSNTYFLTLLTGDITLAPAYALAPLVVLLYLKAINARRALLYVLLCAIALGACGAYEPRVAYVVVLALGLLAATHFCFTVLPRGGLTWRGTARLLIIYASPLALFGLLNAYWLFGVARAGLSGNGIIASSLFGNEFFNMSEALTLFQPYWTGGQIQPFYVHAIPLYFWLIPAAAAAALALNKKRPVLLFAALSGVLGIFLAKQSDAPFPALYHWLFVHVPGFNAFREASKFDLLVALAYAILLPALFWYVKGRYRNRVLSVATFAALALLFLPNLIPIATRQIGATFQPRQIPAQYVRLNTFLDTKTFGRVLWVPQKSRWSLDTAQHPAVSAANLLSQSWPALATDYSQYSNATVSDELASLFQQPYMPAMIAAGDITYVVVPMRDLANDDNFYKSYNDDPAMFAQLLDAAGYLKRAPVQVSGFSVYETVQRPQPYFAAASTLYGLSADTPLSSTYTFWQDVLGGKQPFNFVVGESAPPYATTITDLFARYTAGDLAGNTLPVRTPPGRQVSGYYADQAYSDTWYTAGKQSVTFQTTRLPTPGELTQKLAAPAQTTIPLHTGQTYVIANSSTIEAVDRSTTPTFLGSPRSDTALYAVGTNAVPAPPISHSLWQHQVRDCAPYGSIPANIDLSSDVDDRLNQPVLSLAADDHAACTGPPPIHVKPGSTYLWQFRYRGFSAPFASYRLTYNTPGQPAITTKDIPLIDNDWHTYETVVHVPDNATTVQVQLIVRPSNQIGDHAAVSFTGVKLLPLQQVASIPTATGVIQKTINTLSAPLPPYPAGDFHNLIPNGSFQHGLWHRQVGDCDAYDSQPKLSMARVSHGPGGAYALELGAARHIACTDTGQLPVQGGGTYLLQFDYQSPNAVNAGFTAALDDKNATRITQQIPIKDSRWHTYRQVITIPPDAKHLTLAVYAYSSADSSGYLLDRYTDFVLRQVPDVQHRFYAVSDPAMRLTAPGRITYHTVSATAKTVTVTHATGPFILLMSEQYHPGWQVRLSTRPGWPLPWHAPAALPAGDHFEADGFTNGWLIDPQAVCAADSAVCTRLAGGGYDLHFVVQFAPQAWFNAGLTISGATLAGCLVAIAVLLIARRHRTIVNRRAYVHQSRV